MNTLFHRSRPVHDHLAGWLLLVVLCFLQSPGRTVADTKHDLTANPAGFLRGALHAWTDLFPLGQMQNQAYGYLFPQGLFFLLSEALPDWIAQRLWWSLVLGVGFSGFLVLGARLAALAPPGVGCFPLWAGGLLYALSPHTLTTLGAISSETWPMMLTPWVLAPLVGAPRRGRGDWELRRVAASVLAVAAMGAVNAVATGAACLPAVVVFAWRRAWRPALAWLAGCAAVSLWWLGPLLVLGRYSPPFTDFIESAFVTTRWLSLVEVLRGATSWAPFAEAERIAGTALATNPYFVLATAAFAAIGLVGLAVSGPRALPARSMWVSMFLVGVAVLGAAHGPFGSEVRELLDAPLAALRNLHKFDALVRLPLALGFTHSLGLLLRESRRVRPAGNLRPAVAFSCACLVAVSVLAPAWSGRIAPRGSFESVPSYWQEAAAWLNANAQDTRTMVLPASSFARQTWGWTRDEPIQPLAEVPWVVRDAVPLVPPEAIRSLDGIITRPTPAALRRIGVGVVVVRHDLAPNLDSREVAQAFEDAGATRHDFGKVSIYELDRHHDMSLFPAAAAVRVSGSGESLALLDELHGPHSYELTSENPEIVTDTPALSVRNYGAIHRAESAPLARLSEGADVRNRVPNYPTRLDPIPLRERGGEVAVSSSASDATAFGGADAARSATSAVDGHPETAWLPAPGRQRGQWLELRPEQAASQPEVAFTVAGAPVVVTVSTGQTEINRTAYPGREVRVQLPESEASMVRLTLGASAEPAGIAEAHIEGHDIDRILQLPAQPAARQFVFQRQVVDTGLIRRAFELTQPTPLRIDAATCTEDAKTAAPAETDLQLDGAPIACGETRTLAAGLHEVSTTSRWLTLTKPDFAPPTPPSSIAAEVPAASDQQILNTHRAFNPGLRATVGGVPVAPLEVDAAAQGFVVPAGVSGPVELSFAGEPAYRRSLLAGGILAALTILVAVLLLRRTRVAAQEKLPPDQPGWTLPLRGALSLGLVAGLPGMFALVAVWAVTRWTLIPRTTVAGAGVAVAGMWLSHAPWPSEAYAGDQWFTAIACCVSVAAVCMGRGVDNRARNHAAAGASTNSKDAAATGIVSSTVSTETTRKPPENGARPSSGNTQVSTGMCQRKIP